MRQKKLTTAAAVLMTSTAMVMWWGLAESEAQTSSTEIACTETPDCATLGYTKTASQCPDGGIKCPFDGNKMFCVSGESIDYTYQNTLTLYDIAYSDGTTSQTYNSNKLAIGLIYYIHPNGKRDHGWMISLEQFPANTRAEAIKRCAGFSTKGTRAGDWHLPDMAEIMMMSAGNDATNEYTNLNNAIKKVPGSAQLGSSYNLHYCMSGAADQSKTYLNGKPVCTATNIGSSGGVKNFCPYTCEVAWGSNKSGQTRSYTCPSQSCPATSIYTNTNYWSMSDQPGGTQYLYGNLASASGFGNAASASAKYGHYRCVANF